MILCHVSTRREEEEDYGSSSSFSDQHAPADTEPPAEKHNYLPTERTNSVQAPRCSRQAGPAEREERREDGGDEEASCPNPPAIDNTLTANSTRHIAIQTERAEF